MAGKQTGAALKGVPLQDVSAPERAVPPEETTTLRIERALQEQLKMVAAFERTTINSITSKMTREFLRRYEAATGRSLGPRRPADG